MQLRLIIRQFWMILFVTFQGIDAERCHSNNMHLDCPGPEEPAHFSRCCIHENTTDIYCCENPLHFKTDPVLIFVSITVILTCILISVLMVVCCFWSRCPLFDLCWVNYSKRGVIAYTKEEEALNQPPDENDYAHQYTPVNVKISKVDDV